MGDYEYYEKQINKVDPGCVGVKVQFRGYKDETNWLDINDSSARVIIDYLEKFLKGLEG